MPRPPVPRVVTIACFVACLALAGLIFLVYGTLLLSAVTHAFPRDLTPTLEYFEYLSAHSLSLQNTLVYGVSAAAVSALLAMFAGFLVQRGKWPGRRALDFVLIMPAAIPGLFFGLGYVVAFNKAWLDWVDRGVLIVVALTFWNIPVGYQATVAGLRQIDRAIDEAATSLGASSLRAFRDVIVPMLRGSLRVGFVTTFVRAVTTLSLLIFLFTPQTTVATITIFQLVNDFNWGGATAFTVIDVAMAIVVLVALSAIGGRRGLALGAARA